MNQYNYASIDVGSNSINLLLALVVNEKIVESKTESYITKLGEGIAETKKFSEGGIRRAMDSFTAISKILNYYKISLENVICVATEASRIASNGASFYSVVNNKFGIKTNIISADTEAQLSVLGVLPSNLSNAVILDLGGASSELIYVSDKKINLFESFKVGAVSMAKDFNFDMVKKFVHGTVSGNEIILVGGTAAMLGWCLSESDNFDEDKILELNITLSEIESFYHSIKNLSKVSLVKKYPLLQKRQDSFQNGVFVLKKIIEAVALDQIRFSTNGVRQGALIQHLSSLR